MECTWGSLASGENQSGSLYLRMTMYASDDIISWLYIDAFMHLRLRHNPQPRLPGASAALASECILP